MTGFQTPIIRTLCSFENGYYENEGLNVSIIQPPEGGSAELIAACQAEFGVGYQEQITYARTTKNSLPVKAIAAIIQHNTSGFASPVEKNIKTPKDFEGKNTVDGVRLWKMQCSKELWKKIMRILVNLKLLISVQQTSLLQYKEMWIFAGYTTDGMAFPLN